MDSDSDCRRRARNRRRISPIPSSLFAFLLGFWFLFPFFPLLFIPIAFLFFFGLRWFFWGRWGWNRGWYGPYHDSALETLRERFARGEITKEQFDDMAKTLREKESGE
jgi:putative membrane protein